jgi:hypothetical protein
MSRPLPGRPVGYAPFDGSRTRGPHTGGALGQAEEEQRRHQVYA